MMPTVFLLKPVKLEMNRKDWCLPFSLRYGYPLPYGSRPQQRSSSHQKRDGSQTQPSTRGECSVVGRGDALNWVVCIKSGVFVCVCVRPAADQTQQVCPRHDPWSVRFCSIREASHGAAQSVQGQESPEVHQEEGGCPILDLSTCLVCLNRGWKLILI